MRGHTHNDNDNEHACHKRSREDCECEYPVPKILDQFKGVLNWHRLEKDTGLISSKDEHVKAISRMPVVGYEDPNNDDCFEGELAPRGCHDTEFVHLDPSDEAHDYVFALTCTNPAKRTHGNTLFTCVLTNAQLKTALVAQKKAHVDGVVSIAIKGTCPLFPYRHRIKALLYLEKQPKGREFRIVGFRMKDIVKTKTMFPRAGLRGDHVFVEEDKEKMTSGLTMSRDSLFLIFMTMIKP